MKLRNIRGYLVTGNAIGGVGQSAFCDSEVSHSLGHLNNPTATLLGAPFLVIGLHEPTNIEPTLLAVRCPFQCNLKAWVNAPRLNRAFCYSSTGSLTANQNRKQSFLNDNRKLVAVLERKSTWLPRMQRRENVSLQANDRFL